MADRFDAAASAYERALQRARARGSISSFAVGMAFRSGLAVYRGALAEAEADAQAALDAAREGGVATALPFGLTYLTHALLEQGKLEAAADRLDRFAGEIGGFADMPFFLLARARLLRADGDVAGALAIVLEAARAFAATGRVNPALAAWRSEAALAHLELGDRDAALAIADEEVRLARVWGAPRTLGRALRVAGQAEGGERGLARMSRSRCSRARRLGWSAPRRSCSSARRCAAEAAVPRREGSCAAASTLPTRAARARSPSARPRGSRAPPAQ